MDPQHLQHAFAQGPLRTSELMEQGFSRAKLTRLVEAKALTRLARGLYGLPDQIPGDHHSLVLVARQAPKGVICLLSALQFHGLTTQIPREVWLALEGRSHRPKVVGIRVNIHRFTAEAFHKGVEVHQVAGTGLRVYGVTKTVLDCFRMRNKIGLDVALEALRDSLRQRKTTIGQLDQMARILRIHSVVKPYLEMGASS